MAKVDDLALRRKLEIAIDQLWNAKDEEARVKSIEAKKALTEGRLDDAVRLVTEAQELGKSKTLMQVLVDQKAVVSRAEARRLVASQAVKVDGRVAKDVMMNVSGATSITLKDKEIMS